jgi:hypothetical protein
VCWKALQETSRSFGFSAARLRFDGREFTAAPADGSPAECWSLNVPLNGAGHVELSVVSRPGQAPPTVGPLATSLQTVLAARLRQLQPQPAPKAQAVAFSD